MSRTWHEDELRRVAAVQTLIELLVPVLVGLSALMPNHTWRVMASLCGALGLGLVAWHQWVYHRHPGPFDDFDEQQRKLDVLSVATYSLTLVAGAIGLPTVLALALLWLIFSGGSEALMFMRQRELPPGRERTPKLRAQPKLCRSRGTRTGPESPPTYSLTPIRTCARARRAVCGALTLPR